MTLKRIARVTLIALLLVVATMYGVVARAASYATDNSDVWSDPNEPGWGIQFVQSSNAIFATMYVYGPSGQPTFYTATLEHQAAAFTYSGDLIATTGPWFGTVPFDPLAVTRRVVGTMTWNVPFVNGGTLTYSVDGVSVTKSLRRLLIRYDNYNGTYLGSLHQVNTGCTSPAKNGTSENAANIVIVQSSLNVSMSIASQSLGSCTFAGPLTQAGHMGRVEGSYSCSDGDIGTFVMFEATAGWFYLTARLNTTSASSACQSNGYFAGILHHS